MRDRRKCGARKVAARGVPLLVRQIRRVPRRATEFLDNRLGQPQREPRLDQDTDADRRSIELRVVDSRCVDVKKEKKEVVLAGGRRKMSVSGE
jgi:hypothetical protein